jgi:hypothetical protein
MSFKDNLVKNFNHIKLKTEKHSPEILLGIGIASFVGTVAFTVKGTMSAVNHISDAQDSIDADPEDSDRKRDATLKCAGELTRAYLPAVLCGTASVGCFVYSNKILRTRVVSVAAAYTSLDAGFQEYRNRVIEKYGEDVDRNLKYGVEYKKVKTTEVDPETGKKTKKTQTVPVIDGCSPFGVYFKGEYDVAKTGKKVKNLNWQPNDMFNLTFIKAQCNWFNDKLSRGERVYLSEVLKELGIPGEDYPDARTIGWLPSSEGGDGYIRFNAYYTSDVEDFLITEENEVLLDFNTDGVILYK